MGAIETAPAQTAVIHETNLEATGDSDGERRIMIFLNNPNCRDAEKRVGTPVLLKTSADHRFRTLRG